MKKLFKTGSLILLIVIAALAAVGINYAGMNDSGGDKQSEAPQQSDAGPDPSAVTDGRSSGQDPAWNNLLPDSWKDGQVAYDYTLMYKGEQGKEERINGRLIHGKNMFMDSSSRQIHYRYGEMLVTLDQEEKTAYCMPTSDKGTAFAMSDMGSLFQSISDSLYSIETVQDDESAGRSMVVISARSDRSPVRTIRIAYITREREKSVHSIALDFNPKEMGDSEHAELSLILEHIVPAEDVPVPYLPEISISGGRVVLTGKFREYKLLKS